jgi:hypothetical protein
MEALMKRILGQLLAGGMFIVFVEMVIWVASSGKTEIVGQVLHIWFP